jgi:hypothetical protein
MVPSKRHHADHQSSKNTSKARPGKKAKQKQRTPDTNWGDYIEPDSRRRRNRGQTGSSDGSGEEFDFAEVDAMAISAESELEYDYQEPASTGKGAHVPVPPPSTDNCGGSTGRPRSLQKKLGLIKDNEAKKFNKKNRKVRFSVEIPASANTGQRYGFIHLGRSLNSLNIIGTMQDTRRVTRSRSTTVDKPAPIAKVHESVSGVMKATAKKRKMTR